MDVSNHSDLLSVTVLLTDERQRAEKILNRQSHYCKCRISDDVHWTSKNRLQTFKILYVFLLKFAHRGTVHVKLIPVPSKGTSDSNNCQFMEADVHF